ncbi:MAG TPA: hydroxyisourate hydrolase [Elainellaceae cyanobacterium]
MTGKLTTHVLDTVKGRPAPGMTVELWSLDLKSGERILLTSIITNTDGRTDRPLLENAELVCGVYELVFVVGQYFAHYMTDLPNPPFLNRVPIQFGIADADAHYHVPLLASPWSYSTYRGS